MVGWRDWLRRRPGIPASGDPSAAGIPWPEITDRATGRLRAQTTVHSQHWRLDDSDWNVDLTKQSITFTNAEFTATAAVQVVGSLDSSTGKWQWAWADPHLAEELTRHARLVRDYGWAHRVSELTTGTFPADEQAAWRYAALANLLADAQGAYRGPSGQLLVWFTFGTVTLSGRPAGATAPARVRGLPVVATEHIADPRGGRATRGTVHSGRHPRTHRTRTRQHGRRGHRVHPGVLRPHPPHLPLRSRPGNPDRRGLGSLRHENG
ncbi:DUF6882 domain-containing protein [Actinophytocola sp.]|uniref:DUF6882 domain-containing protein n=1 Tax=Actinophytocola sp. TaxID=1872138 RepID=UPI003D6A5283